MHNLSYGLVISPDNKITNFYDNIIPSKFIHHEFNIDVLNNLLKRQEIMLKKKEKPIDSRVFYIMDGCDYSKKKMD